MEELVIGISVALIEITLEAKSRRAAERRLRGAKRVPEFNFSRNSCEKEEWYSNVKTSIADITSNEDTMHEKDSCEVNEKAGEDLKSGEEEERTETKETSDLAASTNNDREEDTVTPSQTQADEDLIEPVEATDATINNNDKKELVNKSEESALDVYKELHMRVLSSRDRKLLREATEVPEVDQRALVTEEDRSALVTNEDQSTFVMDEDQSTFVTDKDPSTLVVFYSYH